jgi:hypothetical protein
VRLARDLKDLADEDFRMERLSTDELTAIVTDCVVALAFRLDQRPRDILDAFWKTVGSDEMWEALLDADRLRRRME